MSLGSSSQILEDQEDDVQEEMSEESEQHEEVPLVLEESSPGKAARGLGWHPRTRRRQSDVWRFFDRHEDFSKTCRVCNKLFSTTTATGALRKHLARHFGGQTESVLSTAQTVNEVTVSGVVPASGSNVASSSTTKDRKNIARISGDSTVVADSGEAVKNRTKSNVWKFFTKLEDGKPQCRYCAKIYSITVSTSGLQRHINHHNKNEKGGLDVQAPVTRNRPVQRKNMPFDAGSQYLKMLIREHIPVGEAEKNLGLFCNPFTGKVGSTDRSNLDDLLHKSYSAKLEAVSQFLHTWTGSVSVSLELWKSEEQYTFLVATAHLLTDKWKSIRVVLNCVLISPDADAQSIADQLMTIFAEFSISEKVLAVTTGDVSAAHAAEIFKASDEKFHSVVTVKCILREFDVCVRPALKFVQNQTDNIRRFLRTLVNSRKMMELRNVAALMIHDYHEIQLDSPNFWVSTIAMMEAALKMRPVIDDFIKRNGAPFSEIADQDWKILEDGFELVGNFLLAATDMEKVDYPALSNVLPLVEYLLGSLVQIQESKKNISWVVQVSAEMATETQNLLASLSSDVYFFGTILDPRHKLSTLPASFSSQDIQQSLRTAFSRYVPSATQPETSTAVVIRASSYQTGSLMSVILKKSHDSMSQPQIDELNQYLNTAVEQPDVDPLDWWETHRKVYPHLSLMAKDYLSIPATSQPSNQLILKDDRVGRFRNRLDEASLGIYVCLNSWNNFDFVKA